MAVKVYGVYLARFQFLETNAYKIRPVVVVGKPKGPHKIVLVIPLSSKTVKEAIDVELQGWRTGGLAKPTAARVHLMTAVVGNNILEVIGQLEAHDIDALKRALRSILEL